MNLPPAQPPGYRLLARLLLAGLLLVLAGPHPRAGAAEDAVEAGREALQRTGWYPWYDAGADEVRRIRVQPPEEAQRTAPTWDPFLDGDRFTPLAWIGIVTLLAALVYLLVRAYLARQHRRQEGATPGGPHAVGQQVDRVEQLPLRIRRPAADWLAAAGQHYLAGDYREASIYLYSHLLLQLDRRHLIRLNRGKTNRQYLRELGPWASLQGLMENAMVLFEESFFGKRQLDRARFEAVWQRMDEFETLVAQAAAAPRSA
ncbi:MAG: DUF4129 domain-containing protein [Planctomycetales bacterium]|nr:DUF4129 domain-containing protein [Planctomycetales bacterium]